MKTITDTVVLSLLHPWHTWCLKPLEKGFSYILWNIKQLLCNGTSWAKQRQRKMKIKETKIVFFLLLWFRKLKGNILTFLTFHHTVRKIKLSLLSFWGAVELCTLQKGSTSRWDSTGTKDWWKIVCRAGDLQWHFQVWLPLWSASSDAGTRPDKPDSLSKNSSLDAHLFAGMRSQPLYSHSAKHYSQWLCSGPMRPLGICWGIKHSISFWHEDYDMLSKVSKYPGLLKQMLAQSSSWCPYQLFWCCHLKYLSVNRFQLQ